MTPRPSDEWSAGDLDYQQPRCALCGVVMRDIPGGWSCDGCRTALVLTLEDSGFHAISRMSPREFRLRRGA